MTRPIVMVTPVIEHKVSCSECGPLVTYTDTRKDHATRDALEHEEWHKNQESPIWDILEQWEDLKHAGQTIRNRNAIALHCKIDKAVYAHENGVEILDQATLEKLHEINEWILVTAFHLDPKTVRAR